MRNFPLSQKIAYLLRIIAIPPVMTSVLILLVWFNDQIIQTVHELIASFVFLVVIPAAAYPVSFLIPRLRNGGRKTQRLLAFWFAGVGYSASVIYGLAGHKTQGLNFIYLTYLLSVLILAIVNHFSGTKASGHACSVIWPAISVGYYYGWIGIIIGVLVYAAVLWCSLKTKRHTAKEFLLGTFICLASAGISALLVFVLKLHF